MVKILTEIQRVIAIRKGLFNLQQNKPKTPMFQQQNLYVNQTKITDTKSLENLYKNRQIGSVCVKLNKKPKIPHVQRRHLIQKLSKRPCHYY